MQSRGYKIVKTRNFRGASRRINNNSAFFRFNRIEKQSNFLHLIFFNDFNYLHMIIIRCKAHIANIFQCKNYINMLIKRLNKAKIPMPQDTH